MGVRHVIGVGILYASLVYMYTKCTELQCRLTLKNAECELYKAAYEGYAEADKSKNKGKFLMKKKDEE